MTELVFTKMHGAGNDFIIIDNRNRIVSVDEIIKLAPQLCHRRFGIGADGIMALHPPELAHVDYTMIYRNADGSDAGMCGNGSRCLARFAANLGMGTDLKFNVHKKVYRASVSDDGNNVQITFPMAVNVSEFGISDASPIYQMHAGTEHIVQEVELQTFKDDEQLIRHGRQLRYHEQFDPPGTNVNFILGNGASDIKIKTYERGVENLTLACGTGAVAGAIGWHHINHFEQGEHTIHVEAQGGNLTVTFNFNASNKSYSNIKLGGPAQFVFNGTLTLPDDGHL